jgi:hypothetical protein
MTTQLVLSDINWTRTIARAIAAVWAGFWMFFGIASSIGEGLHLPGAIMHVLVPGLIFAGIALFAWRWQMHGAVVLIVSGALVMIIYPLVVGGRFPLSTVGFVLLTMALPPLVAGILLLIDARKHPRTFSFKAED